MEELDAKKVFTDTKDYPLSIIKEMFDDGDIIPQPDYQRDYIMDEKKASKLIESVLLRIPIPTVYLCEESDGTLSIIDGQQRLTSFVKFLKNEITLKNLEEYTDFNGKNKAHAGQNYGNARVHRSAAWRRRHIRAIFKVGRRRRKRTAFGLWKCTVEGCEGGSGQRGIYRSV